MVTAVTSGIKITVDTEFQTVYSNHAMGHYVLPTQLPLKTTAIIQSS